jgi:4-amino-4-deoxy-L-arabinose transferase-like glycosyltransferase
MKKLVLRIKIIVFKNYKIILFISLILCIALFTRLILLDRIPTGMSDDELLYPLQSRSFSYTGKDLTEQWSTLSLSKPPAGIISAYGRVPYIMFSPYFANVHLSMFTSRLPYALLGGFFILVMFLICSKLFSTKVGLIVGLLVAVNPWSIFFSRTAYESPIAMYFAFLMFALLLYLRSWKILFAFPFYILSFYSYLGTNIILPLFTTIIVFYSWIINKKKSTKYYVLFIVLAFLILLFYAIHLPNDIGGGRTSELLNPNLPTIVSDVNWNRRESVQTPVMDLFINKYENSARIFINQYLEAFSPTYLFSTGEGAARYTLWSHGTFYVIDAIFLIFGFILLLKHKRKEALLLLSILLISPIPSALHYGDSQYALRSSFMFPTLLILIGYGIYSFINKFNNKLIPIVLISVVYIIFITNFGYQYIFRNPIYNYDSFGISGRIFAKYIQFANHYGYKAQALENGPNIGLFRQYLFFNSRYTKDNHSFIASLFLKNTINIDNITFTGCKNINLNKSIITIIPFNLKCTNKKISRNIISIANYTDNQPIYLIYNDQVCKKYNLLPYLNNLQLKDFDIEKLNVETFCQKFFTRDVGLNSINSTGSAVPSY